MSQAFTIPYGERDGRLLHVSAVDRGLRCDCVCPVCRDPLVARKGIKTKHHFAHRSGSTCCTETVLHELGKRLLHARLALAIAAQAPVQIVWTCEACGDTHEGNLLKRASEVRLEQSLGTIRPDITLCDSAGQAVALVEIVVSHEPGSNTRDLAAERGLPVVEFNLESDDDLDQLHRTGPLTPTRVDRCLRPKCPRCGRPLYRKRLHVVNATCWRCDHPMKIAMLAFAGAIEGPIFFSEEDLDASRHLGALFAETYGKSNGKRYVANTCPNCHAFVGRGHLHDYYELMAAENGIDLGTICAKCHREER